MGVTAVASNMGGWAVDAYRARLQAQLERRRLATLQFNLLISASLGAVGLVTDTVATQLRLNAMQRALDEAVDAGDLERAELLRGQVISMLQDPPASARLLGTLADYIPAIVAEHSGKKAPVIEGGVAP